MPEHDVEQTTEWDVQLDGDARAALLGVYAFVQSPQGQRWVRRQLELRGLPAALDADIESSVLYEAERTVRAGGEIRVPAAWARQRVASRVVDLVRARVRRAGALGHEVALDDTGLPAPAVSDIDTAVPDDRAADGVRAALRRNLALAEWVCAAGLAVLARLVDESPLVAACPQPKAGANRVDAAHWAGLWYAGRHELFTTAGVKANTLVQRRARVVARVKEALALAHAGYVGRGGDG